jgi:crotonobetainyl-CoA:carnitine CoA-transferase CaiB-like acyl-CoA transferase
VASERDERAGRSQPNRPLEGVRVLDLSRLLPGPFATLILSDLGADVIKVEDNGAGDYLRGFGRPYEVINRDKRSIVLDLKRPEGVAVFRRLAQRADVVLESFRPGVLDKLGVGYPVLAAENPRIIVCAISGYGASGPYRERAGHDLNYIGLGGVLGLGGEKDGPPAMPGVQIADFAGGLWAALGICAALAGRAGSGRGQFIDVSMTEGALAFLIYELANCFAGAKPRRGAGALNGGLACYGVYETKDGRHLTVAALEPKFWIALNQAIGRTPDLAELAAPPEEQARVHAEIAAILLQKTRAEWEAYFADKDVLVEPVLDVEEVPAHPLHAGRRVFFEMTGAGQQMRTPLGSPAAARPAPSQGQHTAEVLREAGLAQAEIDALLAAKIINTV